MAERRAQGASTDHEVGTMRRLRKKLLRMWSAAGNPQPSAQFSTAPKTMATFVTAVHPSDRVNAAEPSRATTRQKRKLLSVRPPSQDVVSSTSSRKRPLTTAALSGTPSEEPAKACRPVAASSNNSVSLQAVPVALAASPPPVSTSHAEFMTRAASSSTS